MDCRATSDVGADVSVFIVPGHEFHRRSRVVKRAVRALSHCANELVATDHENFEAWQDVQKHLDIAATHLERATKLAWRLK